MESSTGAGLPPVDGNVTRSPTLKRPSGYPQFVARYRCPGCGEQSFARNGLVLGCKECGTQGWLGSGKVAGRGTRCKVCAEDKVKTVATTAEETPISYCSACGTVHFPAF